MAKKSVWDDVAAVDDTDDEGVVSNFITNAKEAGSNVLSNVGAFVKEHPTLQRLISGEAEGDADKRRETILNEMKPEAKAKALDYEARTGKKVGQLSSIPTNDSILPEAGHSATEGWPAYLAKGAYNQVVRPLGSAEGFLGAATPGKAGALKGVVEDVPKIQPKPQLVLPEGRTPKLLGPKVNPEVTEPRFIAGKGGVAENRPYTTDLGPVSPTIGQKNVGTVLPRELGEATTISPTLAAQGEVAPFRKPATLTPAEMAMQKLVPDRYKNAGQLQVEGQRIPGPDAYFPEKPNDAPFTTPSAQRPERTKLSPELINPNRNLGVGERTRTQARVAEPGGIPKVEEITPEKLGRVTPPGVPPVVDVPAPGEARASKDVNFLRANFGSVDKTLESRAETAPIAQVILKANDDKLKWISTIERDFTNDVKGLDKNQRTLVGTWLDKGVPLGQESTPLGQRAISIKAKLDKIHSELPEGIMPGGKDVGYIENYLSHMEKTGGDLSDGLKQVWEFHFKKPFNQIFGAEELGSKGTGELGDMYRKGKGNPGSKFADERVGRLKDYELDVKKVLPAYIESIAKLKFDKAAVGEATRLISDLPKSKLKELAGWYVTNYSRYDAMPGLSEAWNTMTSKIMRTTSRTMVGLSSGLQTLHLARIPGNLWPELPTKYLASGLKHVATHPIDAYHETAALGMLSQEIRPWTFKTPMQKMDSILSVGSAADYLDRSVGYHGFKKMYLEQGLNETDATVKAIASSKRASLMSDPARSIKAFNPEPGYAGTLGRLSLQFKQVPTKIIEQYIQIASAAKQNPKAAARLMSGLGVVVGAQQTMGLHTFHLSPDIASVKPGGAFGSVVQRVYGKLTRGDVEGALTDTALFATPGGMSVSRQLEYGPSMFEKEEE